jgi:hypothetical protein
MTKFYEHYEMILDSKTGENVKVIRYFRPENFPNMSIPDAEGNMDYARMMEGVNADPPTNTIEEVNDTPE